MEPGKLEKAHVRLIAILGIDIVMSIVAFIAMLGKEVLIGRIRDGMLSRGDISVQGLIRILEYVSWANYLTMIAVGIALLFWLQACYDYARRLPGFSGFDYERWLFVGWIIPIVNFFMPYNVIREIYKAGSQNFRDGVELNKVPGSVWLLLWWIFCVLSHLILSRFLLFAIFIHGFSIVFDVLWLVVVGVLTNRLLRRGAGCDYEVTIPEGARIAPFGSVQPDIVKAGGCHDSSNNFISALKIGCASFGTKVAKFLRETELASTKSANANADDWAYERVAEELDKNDIDKAQWARALTEAEGDENKTKAIYVKKRVERIVAIENQRLSEISAQRERELEEDLERERQEKNAAEENNAKASQEEKREQIREKLRQSLLEIEQVRHKRQVTPNHRNRKYLFSLVGIASVVLLVGTVVFFKNLPGGDVNRHNGLETLGAQFEIIVPDGRVYWIEAPEGTTEEQAWAYAQSAIRGKSCLSVCRRGRSTAPSGWDCCRYIK